MSIPIPIVTYNFTNATTQEISINLQTADVTEQSGATMFNSSIPVLH